MAVIKVNEQLKLKIYLSNEVVKDLTRSYFVYLLVEAQNYPLYLLSNSTSSYLASLLGSGCKKDKTL